MAGSSNRRSFRLGAATARRLAADGVKVVLVDLQDDLGDAIADQVGGAYVHADVTDADQVQSAIDAANEGTAARSRSNCAGIAPLCEPSTAAPPLLHQFQRVIAINLIGSFNCIRLAAAAMAPQPTP